ncbi:Phenazine biosynthesis PhzF protein [Penicillium robsamsonii]|uniref:Phenazine biosynthesis PhzF protein n=1 Tax=Penicillium robsamsonii TaxID=1792511 RepID=UPI0025479089|nr:Phenazine biosynthesis PhzF protein [Penicillium robsamsonii]KAJ5811211.1 Phenazine biosynthesis PhzF protein [Penicillium robsamsonii]
MEEANFLVLRVSLASPEGEDTVAVIPNAKSMSNQEMEEVASRYRHTSGFVFPAPAGFEFCYYEIRFWTSHYELERCGHAMLLSKLGITPQDNLRIVTKGGLMDARSTKAVDSTDSTKDYIWDI